MKGKYISLKPQKEIVQTWALQSPIWPSGKFHVHQFWGLLFTYLPGHDAILTTTLNQSTETTKVIFSLAGVPLGMQDEIKRNIEGY